MKDGSYTGTLDLHDDMSTFQLKTATKRQDTKHCFASCQDRYKSERTLFSSSVSVLGIIDSLFSTRLISLSNHKGKLFLIHQTFTFVNYCIVIFIYFIINLYRKLHYIFYINYIYIAHGTELNIYLLSPGHVNSDMLYIECFLYIDMVIEIISL